MEVRDASEKELRELLKRSEDHFNDFKSKRISPSKLQESFIAFANSDGGDLFIGIEDSSFNGQRLVGFLDQEEANSVLHTLLEETVPSVENLEIEYLDAKKQGLILHIQIPKSPKVHYTASNDCFIRVNASKRKIKGQRITELGYSKGAEPYEKKAVINAELGDILESDFLQTYERKIGTELDSKTFLRKQQLINKIGIDYVPNVACILLFDNEAQATLNTRCAVKVYRLRTTEQDYKREQLEEMPITITGTIEEIIKKTITQVQKYIDNASFRDGEKLVRLFYPATALKEILVNAVIHRDYSINDDIHVKIFDNRVEVQSPGRLPGYMTLNNLYTDRFSRNPNIVRLLHNLPDPVNHDIGEGLDTAKNELKKAGLVDPTFSETDNSFVVTIRHQRIASIEDVIQKHFEENPNAEITNKLVRQLSGEDDMQKVKSSLQKMRAAGMIQVVDEKVSAFNYRYKRVRE